MWNILKGRNQRQTVLETCTMWQHSDCLLRALPAPRSIYRLTGVPVRSVEPR
jgi:hypothetical protein